MKDINRVLELRWLKFTALVGLFGLLICPLFMEDNNVLTFSHWKGTISGQATAGAVSRSIDPRCISRSAQHLYRANKAVNISPVLLEAWEHYGELHRKCSVSNWTELLLDQNSSISSSCKFLIYDETDVGMGNKILSLLSALLYAMITDRVLMIDSRKEVGQVLCEPFRDSSWLLPADFPYELMRSWDDKSFQVPVVHLYLDHLQKDTDKLFFCDELEEPLDKIRTLVWSSNQYYITAFFKVPWMWKRLLTLFPGSWLNVFSQLSSLAIAPADSVWSLVTRFHNSYLSYSKSKVGVQIRPNGRPAFDPRVKQIVLKCLTDHRLVPVLSTNSSESLLGFEKRHGNQVDVSVFVASLQGKYYETFRDEFLRNGTVSQQLVSFYTMSSEGAERHDLQQARLALAEMWLLSFSHHLVMSEFSTFGYISRGLARMRPWMLKFKGTDLHTDGNDCYLSQSSEPCTHFPQQPGCSSAKNLTEEHRQWIDRHIGGCEDHAGGLQLLVD